MIVHLHKYNENHSSCPYCAFQKLKRARNTNGDLETGFLKTIAGKLNNIINEISTHLDALDKDNLFVSNLATNNLKPLGTILDRIENDRIDVTVVESLLFKTTDVSFGIGANRDLTLDDKRRIIQIDNEKLNSINLGDFKHFVFIDDVYDTGASFQIAKEKMVELGIREEDISLITILNI